MGLYRVQISSDVSAESVFVEADSEEEVRKIVLAIPRTPPARDILPYPVKRPKSHRVQVVRRDGTQESVEVMDAWDDRDAQAVWELLHGKS